jgi:diguanylate cyclase (GGDEF)-like protein
MRTSSSEDIPFPGDYSGCILTESFSRELKKRVARCIRCYQETENIGNPSIQYLSAWKEKERIIWYEFVGEQFRRLLMCERGQEAEVFRDSILERRVYKYDDFDHEVQQEALDRTDLMKARKKLRTESKKTGFTEAVYKVSLKGGDIIWLKDQAVVEFYPRDHTSLSLGCLMVVTKEMAVEEQLTKTETALHAANRELEHLANLDGLTQIANRRSFDCAMQREWKRLRRETGVLSLIFCDVDDFKAFNDTYGHQAGDNCLRNVARVLSSEVKRPADLAARYGGEEFAVILPNTSAEGAFHQAESFRSAIETLLIPHAGSSTGDYVTVSFGVATFVPGDDATPEDLIAKADAALYKAKESGRNKVVALLFEPDKGA